MQFKPAIREQVGLILGLIGNSGSGKTFSSLRLATGICGDKRFVVLDTEAGRSQHYSDQFKFDVGDLKPPFSPANYANAIKAADEAGYPVIVVDSMSHEWCSEGGVLEMQEAELDRMAGDNWQKREACRMAAWIKPKMEHKKMVQRLLQVRAHLILCFRAEEKVEMIKDPETGKIKIVPKASVTGLDGWIPVCEKNLPYELTASFLLLASNPGIPHAIKLQSQHKTMFPPNKVIDEAAGLKVAAWAAGGAPPPRKEIAPLSDDEADELISTLDVKTRSDLVAAYNAGIVILKERGNKAQFEKFKSWRDEMLTSIESTQIS